MDTKVIGWELEELMIPCRWCGAEMDIVSYYIVPSNRDYDSYGQTWKCKSSVSVYTNSEEETFSRSSECIRTQWDKKYPNGVRAHEAEEYSQSILNGVRGHVVEEPSFDEDEYIRRARSFAPSLKRIARLMFWADKGKNVKS